MIKRISLFMVAILLSLALFIAPANAVNAFTVDPELIQVGQSVTITVETDCLATGNITVIDPLGFSWMSYIPINIPVGGGSQQWTFPNDFPFGANTLIEGWYWVVANLTMCADGHVWITQSSGIFLVEKDNGHDGRIGGELVSIDKSSTLLSCCWLLTILLFIPLIFIIYKRRYRLLTSWKNYKHAFSIRHFSA